MAVIWFEFMIWIMAFLAILLVAGFFTWLIFCVEVRITYAKNRICVIITIDESDDDWLKLN